MDKSNFDDKQGEHPIPHSKGITDKDNRNPKSVEVNNETSREEDK
jgi:hypothetical protein